MHLGVAIKEALFRDSALDEQGSVFGRGKSVESCQERARNGGGFLKTEKCGNCGLQR